MKIESELSVSYLAEQSLTAGASSLFSGGLFIYPFVASIYGVSRVNLAMFVAAYALVGALGLMGLTLWCLGNVWHDHVRPRLFRQRESTGPVNVTLPAAAKVDGTA